MFVRVNAMRRRQRRKQIHHYCNIKITKNGLLKSVSVFFRIYTSRSTLLLASTAVLNSKICMVVRATGNSAGQVRCHGGIDDGSGGRIVSPEARTPTLPAAVVYDGNT